MKVGDWVEVRSQEEILATLDENGALEGMPFMPEMLAYCSQRFRVYKSAHKTCDTVFPVRGRRVKETIHLTTRCSGEAHGGCQAGCLLFWKEAWVKPVDGPALDAKVIGVRPRRSQAVQSDASQTPAKLAACATRRAGLGESSTYVCQATQLPYATSHLAWWDIRQYIQDYRSGNVGLRRMVSALCYAMFYKLSNSGIGLGRPLRYLHEALDPLGNGALMPRTTGTIPVGQPTPAVSLDLQPGEVVRIKPHREILKTLDRGSKNRGLWWDAEMVPHCGKTYTVLKRVTRIIDERTGKMLEMKTPCIILDNVVCESRYSECRYFCPRSIYSYWREIWLERVSPPPPQQAARSEAAQADAVL